MDFCDSWPRNFWGQEGLCRIHVGTLQESLRIAFCRVWSPGPSTLPGAFFWLLLIVLLWTLIDKLLFFSFCLPAPGLSWHMGSSSPARNWTWAPCIWEHGVLTPGPSGKSCKCLLNECYQRELPRGRHMQPSPVDSPKIAIWEFFLASVPPMGGSCSYSLRIVEAWRWLRRRMKTEAIQISRTGLNDQKTKMVK